jgi:hypothetical protein
VVGRESDGRHGADPHTNDEGEDPTEPTSPLWLRVQGKHEPLELRVTQSVAKPFTHQALDLARLDAERSSPDRMDPNVDPKPGRVTLVEHRFHACPILHQHVSSPLSVIAARLRDAGRLESQHPDERRERETGFLQAALARIASIA